MPRPQAHSERPQMRQPRAEQGLVLRCVVDVEQGQAPVWPSTCAHDALEEQPVAAGADVPRILCGEDGVVTGVDDNPPVVLREGIGPQEVPPAHPLPLPQPALLAAGEEHAKAIGEVGRLARRRAARRTGRGPARKATGGVARSEVHDEVTVACARKPELRRRHDVAQHAVRLPGTGIRASVSGKFW